MTARFIRAVPLCLALVTMMAGPSAAQGLLRMQTNRIQDAIQNQIRQAVKPILTVRNSAGEVEALSLSADGHYLAIVLHDGTVRLWDLRGGLEVARLTSPAGRLRAVRISPDDRMVATGGENGSLALWDAASGNLLRQLPGHRGAAAALAFSTDSAVLASGGADGIVRLWDARSGAALASLRGHDGELAAIAFAADGKQLVSGGADGRVILWDRAKGSSLATFAAGGGRVVTVGFDAGGRVVASTADCVVHLWERNGTREALTFRAAPNAASAEVTDDGKYVAVSDAAAKVNLVELDNGRLVRELSAPSGSSSYVLVDVNQRRILTGGADGAVRVWNIGDGANLAQIISTLGGWAVVDSQGRFDGSQQGVDDVAWVANQTALPIDHFSPQFYEPGLLAKHMSDRPSFVAGAPTAIGDGIFLPPQSAIAAPPGAYAAGAAVEVTVTAQDQGGGIGEVRLFQNGKLLSRDAVIREDNTTQNRIAVRTTVFRATLAAGANHLEGSASSQAQIDGVAAVLDIVAGGSPILPNLHIVTVGINKYKDRNLDLDYGAPDALAVLQRLSLATNGVFGKVVAYKLLDEAASKAGILAVLDGLRQTRPDDVVALYLAGHGEIVGTEWYFLPGDVVAQSEESIARTSISASQFRDALGRMGAQRILVLIDACKSGGSIDAFSGAMDRKVLREVGREAGVAILAATRKDQLAAELPSLGHGAFTYVLLDGLSGKADRNPTNGQITAAKLLGWSSRALPSFTERSFNYLQVPVAYSRGADFLLSRSEPR